MKGTLLAVMIVLAGAFAAQAEMSLADARGRIGDAIASADTLKETMKELSAADQKAFVAELNKAIGQLPGSASEKAKKFLAANHAALVSAKKGNVATLLAEVFATVPVSALPLLAERFAVDLLNRSANPERTYTDAQFEKIALEVMSKINGRMGEVDKGDIRSVFAVIMLARASNGTPADLSDKLVETLPNKETAELAKKEWIPAALAAGKSAEGSLEGYEAILAAADVDIVPEQVLKIFIIQGPQFSESILNDLAEVTMGLASTADYPSMLDAVNNVLVHQTPVMGADVPGGAGQAGGAKGADTPDQDIKPLPEPKPYDGQKF